ncbi:hypothetical protein SAMN04488134_102138 [Amphibacillus marinus]|uniref:Uncharacterized protein n=1 Tax=Amphibacillus marinus TaxID=872970 RepID=A0A1H8K289_9BACI|nr:hypothetical protein [Amphibacillus marinus]SEN86777.1 hypothetical protein SAMN04488134_102138 [Amphibacillus marinus]
MEFDRLKQQQIYFYLNIDDEVQRISQSIKKARIKFYDQSLISSVQATELGVHSVGFNVAKEVVSFVDMVAMLERRIQGLRKKERYAEDYLQSLSDEERSYLVNRYRNQPVGGDLNQIELAFYEEILEIEEAMNHMRNIESEPSTEGMALSNDTLDIDFSSILEMVGV